MKDKFCPLMGFSINGLTTCKAERCAWWDKKYGQCVVFSFIAALYGEEPVSADKEVYVNERIASA